jgi:hypothetical protein
MQQPVRVREPAKYSKKGSVGKYSPAILHVTGIQVRAAREHESVITERQTNSVCVSEYASK